MPGAVSNSTSFADRLSLLLGCGLEKPVDTSVTSGGPATKNFACSVTVRMADSLRHGYSASFLFRKSQTNGSNIATEGIVSDNTNSSMDFNLLLGEFNRSKFIDAWQGGFVNMLSGSESGIGYGGLDLKQPDFVNPGTEDIAGNRESWKYFQLLKSYYGGAELRHNKMAVQLKGGLTLTTVNPLVDMDIFRQWPYSALGVSFFLKAEIGLVDSITSAPPKMGFFDFFMSLYSDTVGYFTTYTGRKFSSGPQAGAASEVSSLFPTKTDSDKGGSTNDIAPVKAILTAFNALAPRASLATYMKAEDADSNIMQIALIAKEAARSVAYLVSGFGGEQRDVGFISGGITGLNTSVAMLMSELGVSDKTLPFIEFALGAAQVGIGSAVGSSGVAGSSLISGGASTAIGVGLDPTPRNNDHIDRTIITWMPIALTNHGIKNIGMLSVEKELRDSIIAFGATFTSPALSAAGLGTQSGNTVTDDPTKRDNYSNSGAQTTVSADLLLKTEVQFNRDTALRIKGGPSLITQSTGKAAIGFKADALLTYKKVGFGVTAFVNPFDPENKVISGLALSGVL